ncbi:MAG: 2-dehydropantoate 2-reductase [Candidatus Aminicenantes bacterium]|nr:2-dehydropantoate 2-reductase [Candidatus Aminicenantes bacterium]
MKIAVIGAGGVGGYFGGRLASAGNDVVFVARGAHGRAIRERGLTVRSVLGDFRIEPAAVVEDIAAIGNADLVLLGVKAWQVKGVAAELRGVIGGRATVLPLQNGVMAAQEVDEALGPGRVVGGLCRIFSRIESPGVILHSGLEPSIAFGELDGRKTDRCFAIRDALAEAGIAVLMAENIRAALWKKFMAICVCGLLALARSPYGIARELEETRALMIGLMTEIYAVASRLGILKEPAVIGETMALIDSFAPGSFSSLTRDVMEGRPSEIEYQNGTVVRFAAELGIDVPINRFVYGCILPMEKAARARA